MKNLISAFWARARQTSYEVALWPKWKRQSAMGDDRAFRTLLYHFDASDKSFAQILKLAPEVLGDHILIDLDLFFGIERPVWEQWCTGEGLPEDAPARHKIAHFLRRHLEWNVFVAAIEDLARTHPLIHQAISEGERGPDRRPLDIMPLLLTALVQENRTLMEQQAELKKAVNVVFKMSDLET